MLAIASVGNAQQKEYYRITNNSGFILATLTVTDNDVQELHTYKGVYLGRYVTHMNTTYDSIGRVIGAGNLISILINHKDEE